MRRKKEFALGLIGSILGFLGSFLSLYRGSLNAGFHSDDSGGFFVLGWVAVILSILGVVGSVVVRGNAKPGAICMLISAVGGVICISLHYAPAAILLAAAGLMGLFKKNKGENVSA
ncbi:DUF4064 domain-containing protein [Metabacillus sp. GX 13764]|nr:DUF4064 domain-containing protein [Metabacillus kandeliae]MCD7036458.1 DUF4064 domain-containing protein [Metabacillus kandeliae]